MAAECVKTRHLRWMYHLGAKSGWVDGSLGGGIYRAPYNAKKRFFEANEAPDSSGIPITSPQTPHIQPKKVQG